MVLLSPGTIALPVAPGTVGFSSAGTFVAPGGSLPVVTAGLDAGSPVGTAIVALPPPVLPGLLVCAEAAVTRARDSVAVSMIERKIRCVMVLPEEGIAG